MIINQLDNTKSNSLVISLSSLNITSVNNFSRTITINQQPVIFSAAIVNSKLSISQSIPNVISIS
jgi:hypothetical protein